MEHQQQRPPGPPPRPPADKGGDSGRPYPNHNETNGTGSHVDSQLDRHNLEIQGDDCYEGTQEAYHRSNLLKEARQRNVSWVLDIACVPAPVVREKEVQTAVYERGTVERILEKSSFHPDLPPNSLKEEQHIDTKDRENTNERDTDVDFNKMETNIVEAYTALAKKCTSKLRALRAVAETVEDLRIRGPQILQALKDTSELASTLRALTGDQQQDNMSESRGSSSFASVGQEAHSVRDDWNALTAATLPPWRKRQHGEEDSGSGTYLKEFIDCCEEALHLTSISTEDVASRFPAGGRGTTLARIDEFLDTGTLSLLSEMGVTRQEIEQYDNFVLKMLRPEASDIIEMMQNFAKRIETHAPQWDLASIQSDAEFLWPQEEHEDESDQFSDNASTETGYTSQRPALSTRDNDSVGAIHSNYALAASSNSSPTAISAASFRRTSELVRQSPDEVIYNFLNKAKRAMKDNPLWRQEPYLPDSSQWNSTIDGLHRFVFGLVYPFISVGGPKLDNRDAVLHRAFSNKSFCTFNHLELPSPPSSLDNSWRAAQIWIKRMEEYKAPKDKIQCLLNACSTITAALEMQMSGVAAQLEKSHGSSNLTTKRITPQMASVGADDMLPVLIYCVIHACPPKFYSCIHYIGAFKDPAEAHSAQGYFYTNLLSAVSFAKDTLSEQLEKMGTQMSEKIQKEDKHESTHQKVMENLEQWHRRSTMEHAKLAEELSVSFAGEGAMTKSPMDESEESSRFLEAARSLCACDFDESLESLQKDKHDELDSLLQGIVQDSLRGQNLTNPYFRNLYAVLEQEESYTSHRRTHFPRPPMNYSHLMSCIQSLEESSRGIYAAEKGDGWNEDTMKQCMHNHETTWKQLWMEHFSRKVRGCASMGNVCSQVLIGSYDSALDKRSTLEDECETHAFSKWLEERLEPLYNTRAAGHLEDRASDAESRTSDDEMNKVEASQLTDTDQVDSEQLKSALKSLSSYEPGSAEDTTDVSVFGCAPPQPLTIEIVDSIATALQYLHNDVLPSLQFDPYNIASVLGEDVGQTGPVGLRRPNHTTRLIERRKALSLLDDMTHTSLPALLTEYRCLATVMQRLISMSVEEFSDEE